MSASISTPNRPEPVGTVWVCISCLFKKVNDESPEPSSEYFRPWSKLTGADVTLSYNPETTEGFLPFGTSPCEGCGDHFAGQRFEFAVWAWDSWGDAR